MPVRGGSLTPKTKRNRVRAPPKVKAPSTRELQRSVSRARAQVRAGKGPKADTGDVTRNTKVDTRPLRRRVAAQRKQVKRGKGPKADTGDVRANTRALTIAERRREVGRQFPSGRQSALSQVLHGQSEATKQRDEALKAFDRAVAGEGLRLKGQRKPTPERAASDTAAGHATLRARRAKKQAEVLAPAVKVLDQTLRPIRAVAGSTQEIVKGRPERVPGAVKRGLIENKGPTFGKVLRDAGAPKGVAAAVGFGLDVALDPTTYLTAGASVPARKVAESAARRATADAVRAGASKKAADKAGRAAAAKTLKDPELQNKGLTVGVRAKVPFTKKPQVDVKTSGRTTAAISRKVGVSKVATALREGDNAIGRKVQRHAPELIHDFRPKGVTPAAHAKVRQAQREFRADTAKARREAERNMDALRKKIPDIATSERIIDHIESGRPLKELGEHAATARAIRRMQGEDFDAKKARELMHLPYRPGRTKDAEGKLVIDPLKAATEPQRYLPRVRRIDLEPNRSGQMKRSTGRTKVAAGKPRTMREPMDIVRETSPATFSEDLPKVLTHSRLNTRESAAVADFWKKVAKTGRPLDKNAEMDLTDEIVFKVTPRGLEPLVKPGKDRAPDLKAIAEAQRKEPSKHIILNRDHYDRIAKSEEATRLPLAETLNRAQGLWKTAVTTTPGFHIRNLVGDTQLAHLADTSAPAFRQATKLLEAKAHRNKRQRGEVGGGTDTTKPMTIGGKTQSREAWVDEAERFGAIDQGFMGREIESQAQRSPGKILRGLQYREDLPRLATYISARERGMSPGEASGHVALHHFDYGDLTSTEKALRAYGFPFWTFFARNTRLQATKIMTRPGKSATMAKLMEEAAQLAGFRDYEEYAKKLPDNQQRGLPIPIKTDKGVTSWTYMPPATDLNAISTKPKDFVQNVAQRITAAKLVAEMYANHSVFFQGPIERENAKLVPAPKILGSLPPAIRKKIGVEKFRDKRRGMIWGWPAKTDYLARQFPQTNLLVQSLTPVPGERGKSGGQAAIGTTTGFRPSTYAHAIEDEAIRREQKKLHELTVKRNNLGRTPKATDKQGYASPALVKLRAQVKAADERVKELKAKRGDDVSEQRIDLSPQDEMSRKWQELQEKLDNPEKEMEERTRRLQEKLDRLGG